MAKVPNKLLGRAEIRNILRELANDAARFAMLHRDSNRRNVTHNENACLVCARMNGEVKALEAARRHFGGR